MRQQESLLAHEPASWQPLNIKTLYYIWSVFMLVNLNDAAVMSFSKLKPCPGRDTDWPPPRWRSPARRTVSSSSGWWLYWGWAVASLWPPSGRPDPRICGEKRWRYCADESGRIELDNCMIEERRAHLLLDGYDKQIQEFLYRKTSCNLRLHANSSHPTRALITGKSSHIGI